MPRFWYFYDLFVDKNGAKKSKDPAKNDASKLALLNQTKPIENKEDDAKVSLTFSAPHIVRNLTDYEVPKEHPCLQFHAKIWAADTLYEIEPQPSSSLNPNVCHNMHMTVTQAENADDFEKSVLAGHITAKKKRRIMETAKQHVENGRGSRRDLQQIIPFTDCFADQYLHIHVTTVGLLIDDGFLGQFGMFI